MDYDIPFVVDYCLWDFIDEFVSKDRSDYGLRVLIHLIIVMDGWDVDNVSDWELVGLEKNFIMWLINRHENRTAPTYDFLYLFQVILVQVLLTA